MNKPTDLSKVPPPPLTEADLRKRLGPYVAPVGLYPLSKARPFVGKVRRVAGIGITGAVGRFVHNHSVTPDPRNSASPERTSSARAGVGLWLDRKSPNGTNCPTLES